MRAVDWTRAIVGRAPMGGTEAAVLVVTGGPVWLAAIHVQPKPEDPLWEWVVWWIVLAAAVLLFVRGLVGVVGWLLALRLRPRKQIPTNETVLTASHVGRSIPPRSVNGIQGFAKAARAQTGRALSDDVLEILRTDTEDWDELTGNLRGLSLSFQCICHAAQEIADCRLRHEKLEVQADDKAWYQQKWLRPTYLEWEREGTTFTFRSGAQRVAHLVFLDNWSTIARPKIRLASGAFRNLEYPGPYRASLSVEASGFRVRQIVVEFSAAQLGWLEVQDPALRQFQPSTPRTPKARPQ